MRIIGASALLAAILIPAMSAAQNIGAAGGGNSTPHSVVLGPGEILLTVRGRGLQVSTPDFASQFIAMSTTGGDNLAAVAANQKLIAQVKKLLIDAGVDPSAIQMLQGEATARMGFVGNEAYDPDEGAAALQKAMPKSFASSSMLVRFTNLAMLNKVRPQLQAITEVQLNNPTYGLNDDAMAKRAAVDQALAKAKIDSAIYAKAMNMRIDRIVAVRDVAGSFGADSFMEMMAERGQMPGSGVRTEARIEIDVVLKAL